jgi:DNA-binding transcriptional LysR family regulator
MHYKLSDLQVFARAARAASLSAAARQLQLTPAAVSAVVKRLEQALGAKLFERSARVLRLTPAGEAFLPACDTALEALADGEASVRQGQREVGGVVHLAAPSDLARTVLNELLPRFLARHPQLRIVLHASDALHDLPRDAVDLALRYGTLKDSGLVARLLADTQRLACASPDYLRRRGVPQHPTELAQHDCLLFQVGGRLDATWRFERDGETVEVDVGGPLAADDSALARQWAVEGRGIVCKSDIDLAADIRQGRLVPLLPEWRSARVPLQAVHAGGRRLPQRVRALLDFLITELDQFKSS